MLKLILILLIVAIGFVLIKAATKPGTFCTQRSASIKAAPERMFVLINDLTQWPQWSPWEKAGCQHETHA